MKILHFCAGLEGWNGMSNTARQFVQEELAQGHDSHLTNKETDVGGGVDVVHIHGSWLPVLWRVSKKAKKIGAKLIVRPAGSYDPVRRSFHAWKKLLVAPWEHGMLNRADVVQATCAAEAAWIKAYHPKARVELTDLKRFFRIPEKICLSALNGITHVLYLGRRHPLKGVEYLEKAVRELNDGGTALADLRIVSGHFGEELERDWVWSDVLVLPTLSENFGRVVAEALERGKRVITTDGAPAWEGQPGVLYLKGFRDGTDEERVRLLMDALSSLR
ncbi:MAG: glycosyltransferase [Kiritimatiellia bacterium]